MASSNNNNKYNNNICILWYNFIIIGIIILIYSNKIHEVSIRYDTDCTEINTQCEATIKIEKKIEKDVMVYYQINNFIEDM